MTPEIWGMLDDHLAESRIIAAKPDPLTTKEKAALYVLIEIVSNLKPRIHLLSGRATAKARAELALKTKDDVLNAIIAEEDKPGLKRSTLLGRVNASGRRREAQKSPMRHFAPARKDKKSGRPDKTTMVACQDDQLL
jgi:hypothetical protein